jgi:L-ribulokinase
MLLADVERFVPGVGGIVKSGITPGYFGYESGQAAVGDIFEWYAKNALPGEHERAAAARSASVYELLESRAADYGPGQSGLLALDWWNGNRSVLSDSDLSGMIIGLTLGTRPEAIYRALIEATAYGTRAIIDAHEAAGVTVSDVVACGGLARRTQLLMQIYADVLGRAILVPEVDQASALGAAMFGAVAAGEAGGGYQDIVRAAASMAPREAKTFIPSESSTRVYDSLYSDYLTLHDYFGRGVNDVMHRLSSLRKRHGADELLT